MNKEEAIQEVNFIKRILDETGREIVKVDQPLFGWVWSCMFPWFYFNMLLTY